MWVGQSDDVRLECAASRDPNSGALGGDGMTGIVLHPFPIELPQVFSANLHQQWHARVRPAFVLRLYGLCLRVGHATIPFKLHQNPFVFGAGTYVP